MPDQAVTANSKYIVLMFNIFQIENSVPGVYDIKIC